LTNATNQGITIIEDKNTLSLFEVTLGMSKNGALYNVCVIGSSNIDIHVNTDKLEKNNSVLGDIHVSPGGVGRNIAEGLGYLGVNTLFISQFSNDVFSHYLVDSLNKQYVDISLSSKEAPSTSTYVNLIFSSGEYGINNIETIENFNISFFESRLHAICSCPLIVFDLNIPTNILHYLLNNVASGLICEATSPIKCLKIRENLSQVYILKSNYKEACTLLGIDKQIPYCELLTYIQKTGVQKAFITHGANGAIAMDSNQWIWYRTDSLQLDESTGAGDYFTSCIIYGEIHKYNLSQNLEFALKSTYLKLIDKSVDNALKIEKSPNLDTIQVIKCIWDTAIHEWVEES